MMPDISRGGKELTWIRRAAKGDHEAFRNLVLMYEAKLLAYLTHMLGDADNARDVAQETFVAVYYSLPNWDSTHIMDASGAVRENPLAPWLYRIATNKAISLLRKRSFYTRPPTQQRDEQDWEQQATRQLSSSAQEANSPEDRYVARELLVQALQHLSEEDAACLVLHVVSGERYNEIATRLGMTAEAVRKRVSRSLVALRKIYTKLDMEVCS